MSSYDSLVNKLFTVLKNDYAAASLLPEGILSDETKAALITSLDQASTPFQASVVLQRYIAALKNPSVHLIPTGADETVYAFTRGIRARRKGENLHVLPGSYDGRFFPGDIISDLNARPLSEIRASYPDLFDENLEDWEEDWSYPILASHNCMCSQGGRPARRILLKKFPLNKIVSVQETTCVPVSPEAAAIVIPVLDDPEPLQTILDEQKEAILSSRYLIVDLRNVSGGIEDAFFPLIPYLFDQDVVPAECLKEHPYYYNYTDHNCAVLKKDYLSLMSNCDEDTLELVTELLADLKVKKGKGLILEEDDCPEEWNTPISSVHYKGHVLLLTDISCEGTAERLVRLCSTSPKVTVMGRHTAGRTGYFNPTRQVLDENYILEYPAGVSADLLDAKKSHSDPVPAQIEIPWDPSVPETFLSFLRLYKKSANGDGSV